MGTSGMAILGGPVRARSTRRVVLSRTARTASTGAAVAGLAACGLADRGRGGAAPVKFGDPVTIGFWHTQTGTNQRTIDEFATKFGAANGKNITLRAEYQGSYQQVFQKTLAAVAAGSPPDTAVAYENMVVEYAKQGAVVDLADYLDRGPTPLPKDSLVDIFPALLQGSRYETFGGKLLSFPFAKGLAVLYTNDEVAARALGGAKMSGATFEDFKRQVAALTRKESNGRTQVYGHYVRRDAAYVNAFILANGGEVLSRDQTKVRFQEEPGMQIFEMWAEMARLGQAYTSEGFNYQADFGQAKVASLHDSSTSRPFIREETKDRFRWSIGMLPQKDPAKPVTVMFGGNVSVFKSSPLKQAAAWEWLKFLVDKEQTALWSVRSGFVPLRQSAAEHPDVKALWEKEPQARQAFELVKFARPEPNLPAWQDVREVLQTALASVLGGKVAARAALEDAARQANKLLEEHK
jgi:ABC-type glycerol-3-phosphate transport system substrate-binding protein